MLVLRHKVLEVNALVFNIVETVIPIGGRNSEEGEAPATFFMDAIFEDGILTCGMVAIVGGEWIWLLVDTSQPKEVVYFTKVMEVVVLHNLGTCSSIPSTTAATKVQI